MTEPLSPSQRRTSSLANTATTSVTYQHATATRAFPPKRPQTLSSIHSIEKLRHIRSNSDASLLRGAPKIQPSPASSKSRPLTAGGALESHGSTRNDTTHSPHLPDGQNMAQDEDVRTFDLPDSDLPPLPLGSDGSFLLESSELANSNIQSDGSALMEREMKRKLMDVESSFLPEVSPGGLIGGTVGADDTYVFGGSSGGAKPASQLKENDQTQSAVSVPSDSMPMDNSDAAPTPSDAYQTPAPFNYDHEAQSEVGADQESNVEHGRPPTQELPSSPAAAAAERTLSRAVNVAAVNSHSQSPAASETPRPESADGDALSSNSRPISRASTVKASSSALQAVTSSSPLPSEQSATPAILNLVLYKQIRNVRESDATLGADYALQTGGAAPSSSERRPTYGLSRLPSLGSIASSVSGWSESPSFERTGLSLPTGLQHETTLETLAEEGKPRSASPPATPRLASSVATGPTDTVIAQHVQNIQVPDTIAREYRERHGPRPSTTESIALSFQQRKNNLTLKEQNSKIDKLSKENFDLKLKIHFLDQALQNRSDEGVKDMINKNVQLQTDLANEKKESQFLRRTVRDLERKLKAQEDGLAAAQANGGSEDEKSNHSSCAEGMEEEITYLREMLQHSEVELEKLREENLAKEVEKRRMAEYVKSMGDRRGSEPSAGASEAMVNSPMARYIYKDGLMRTQDMLRDLLEAETARREQADEDNQKLREELIRLKSETMSTTTTNHVRNIFHISKRNQRTSFTTKSQSEGSEQAHERNGAVSASSITLVDQLKHENDELQRKLGAQVSMLTTQRRDKERLQQEIEDLKLAQRRGDGVRSVAGDSILERSVSRAHQRSLSRASGATRITQQTQISDVEREEYENKQAALRDDLAQTKLLNQQLEQELNAHLDLLTQTENEVRALKAEKDLTTEDLRALQAERDEALLSLQEKETEYDNLRVEAEDIIAKLEDEIDQKESELNRMGTDLENRTEDFTALQAEMRNVSESLIALEDDRDASQRKIQSLEQEIEDANRELDALDKRLQEALAKNQRLEIQSESSQGEIAFLREEQEGDKIKIGELEAALNAAQSSVQDEKERLYELEQQYATEKRQREALESHEKGEVQKMLTELNMQAQKSKDEVRRLRKNLSSKEVEATTWKERLDDLENNLREALGSLDGTKAGFLKVNTANTPSTKYTILKHVQDIHKLQLDLDTTVQQLDTARHDLVEKNRLLKDRDALLENAALETRRLSDLLDKERQARKQDRHQHEQSLRSHQSTTRTIQQHETRVAELETARSHDRRKLAQLEQQYRDQLLERHNLLLALWNRLSTLCGAEWAQANSLVAGELPSLELIARNLPGFSKNVILAVKTVESLIGGFRQRIRGIEKELWREYQNLEHALDVRAKRMDALEKAVASGASKRPAASRSSSRTSETSEVVKLKGENKLLKAELQFQRQTAAPRPGMERAETLRPESAVRSPARASIGPQLLRTHSTSAVEVLQQQHQQNHGGQDQQQLYSAPLQPSEKRWLHRLRELERRLKAEREARLLDRSGARKRLEEGRLENEELRALLERERERRRGSLAESVEGEM
ncbi:hypothetical protein H2199_002248 [Coniosporium tulheliwenetii]|uniref:Uncharacterized protein n=1 Tax=Coniosporium tulheliwenetii TaxID=3383036 RepID=A0ACC2ZIC0_9PEZI|nr:hypothetical protein H2199_002248 [Cladosporium sp. JES 115]